jgi:hypothetical protein
MVAISLVFDWPTRKKPAPSSILYISNPTGIFARHLLTLFALSAVLTTIYRWPPIGPRPYKSGTRIFNAGIWTVHFGIDNIGYDSQRLIRDLIG